MSDSKTCVWEGCELESKARNLCKSHHQKAIRLGIIGQYPSTRKRGICCIEGCLKEHHANGYCNMHDARFKKGADMNAPNPKDPNREKTCSIPNCTLKINSKKLCSFHYQRMKKDIPFDRPFKRRYYSEFCQIEGCESKRKHLGFCAMHMHRKKRRIDLNKIKNGMALPDLIPIEILDQLHFSISKGGYLVSQRNSRRIIQHRAVWEAHNGRKLEKFENIHHINGIRHDNRIENLELWTRPQPSGQRPEDLVAWVIEHYREDVLRAIDTRLELDLQPEGSILES